MRFKRPCHKCEKLFQPTGKSGKLCDICKNLSGYKARRTFAKECPTEHMNYDAHKQRMESYDKTIDRILSSVIKAVGKDRLITALKKYKLIKPRWEGNKETFIERKEGEEYH